ncbi:MAG: hypothetical protein Fur0041_04430 [Bacteroidia bacterium]
MQIKIKINRKTALVIIDTGASRTVFDKSVIKKFLKKESIRDHQRLSTGLGTDSMQSQQVLIKNMSIGDITVKDYDAVVLDLSHVNKTYEMIGFPPVAGVLGSDLMMRLGSVIDYKKMTLTLNPSNVVRLKHEKKASPKKSRRAIL